MTHMLNGKDFILNPNKLEKEFQLVEISPWTDYTTKAKVGFYYTVLLPKLKFEKMKVGIKSKRPIISNQELEDKGQVSVVFDNLETRGSLYNGHLSVKAEALDIRIIDAK